MLGITQAVIVARDVITKRALEAKLVGGGIPKQQITHTDNTRSGETISASMMHQGATIFLIEKGLQDGQKLATYIKQHWRDATVAMVSGNNTPLEPLAYTFIGEHSPERVLGLC